MEPPPRTFTREEAEALLPAVDQLLTEAQALAESLSSTEGEAQAAQLKPRANGQVHATSSDASEIARHSTARQLTALIKRIQELGIVIRDIRSGLIDFPSLRDGRVIQLCWRHGEALEIHWWHEVEAGFAGRQPL